MKTDLAVMTLVLLMLAALVLFLWLEHDGQPPKAVLEVLAGPKAAPLPRVRGAAP